jgi:hypothetical protein
MTQNNTQSKKSKYKSPILIAVVALFAVASLVGAAVTLISPEHIVGTPQNTPSPTPVPSPTATPEPTPVKPTAIHLSSNISGVFYKGDTLELIAQLDQPVQGITVFLWNNGAQLAGVNATTDATGKAVFDRTPVNAFDYHVTATIP